MLTVQSGNTVNHRPKGFVIWSFLEHPTQLNKVWSRKLDFFIVLY